MQRVAINHAIDPKIATVCCQKNRLVKHNQQQKDLYGKNDTLTNKLSTMTVVVQFGGIDDVVKLWRIRY